MPDVTEDAALGPCGVCGGQKSEHSDRHHIFTKGTDLVTHEQAARAKRKDASVQLVVPRQVSSEIVQRLVEVLAARGVLENGDLLYITGLKGREEHGDGS